MKNTLIGSLMVMICYIAFSSSDAYASFHKDVRKPDSKTIHAVHQDFPQAKDIVWIENGGNFIARFNSHDRKITATYSSKGRLLSTLIYSDAEYIPFELQTRLTKKYPDCVAQCMKEYVTEHSHSYYFILKGRKDHRVKWLCIQSDGQGNFKMLQKLYERV